MGYDSIALPTELIVPFEATKRDLYRITDITIQRGYTIHNAKRLAGAEAPLL